MFHSRKHNGVLLFITCTLAILASGIQAKPSEKRSVVIPMVANGPSLKGDMSDAVWNKGILLENFTSISKVHSPIQQTTVRALYDSRYVYLGIKCRESNMSGLVAQARGRNSSVWKDDSVEVLIDTANSKHGFFHFFVNPIGGFFGSKCTRGKGSNEEWRGDFKVKAARGKNAWTAELAIPFSSMGISPKEGLTWGINICRSRMTGNGELSTWSPSPWGFERPEYFGQVVLGNKSGQANGVRLLTWGDMGTADVSATSNKVVCVVPNSQRKPVSLLAILEKSANGKVTKSVTKRTTLASGKSVTLEFPYTIAGSDGVRWTLAIKRNNVETFKAWRDIPAVSEPERVWKLKDPLYKELLSNTPPGDQRYGSIYWVHTYEPYSLPAFAKEYGIRYSNEEAVKEMADQKLLALRDSGSLSRDKFFLSMLDKYHAKVLFYPDIAHWTAPDAPKSMNASYLLDPRSKKQYMDDLKSSLQKWHNYIWGVYAPDEMDNYAMHQSVELYAEHRDDYPYIREVNEQVKRMYGDGKYGIPESLRDTNPYRWIALRKWVSSSLTEWQKDIYETVKAADPNIRVISMDPPGSHRPVSFDRASKYFDIATHQLYPPSDPNRQQFGFITKLVSDLTGKPTWPCVHVEHYAFSTTLDEVRELMSEVARNGGKSFHFWLKDEIGRKSDNGFMMATKWGFPERWKALCDINTLNGRMNEVAVPTDPDSAIFYSEDHYSAFSEVNGIPNEPEWAYTMLGPVSRTWFKFVNDNMVDDGTTDLSRHKAVFVPGAKYERKKVVDSLIKYTANGGILVICDPESFSNDVNGDPLTEARAKLFGAPAIQVKDQDTMTFTSDCPLVGIRKKSLSVTEEVFNLKAGENSEVLASFSDGSPAVVRNRVGKGYAIIFASNPFTQSNISDSAWKDFFKAFAKDLGLETDRDIWRFEYPPLNDGKFPEPEGLCLTGNNVKFWMDVPTYPHNAKLAGTYSYSVQPDGVSDTVTGSIPFGTGKLTDRKSAYTTPTTKLNPDDFTVSWKTTRPVDVTFDLLKPSDVTIVDFWYAGQLPTVKVLGSIDGKTWTVLNTHPKQEYIKPDGVTAHEDVLDVSMKLSAQEKIRYVRLSFGNRDAGNPFSLAECEVWGKAK